MDALELLSQIRERIQWVRNYENRSKSIACNQQSLDELRKKRQKALEFIEYHTNILAETERLIERKTSALRQSSQFCTLHEEQYVIWKNTVDGELTRLLEKSEKLAERIENE